MKNVVLMTRGLPGSGKSTWSRKFIEEQRKNGIHYKRINKDDLRAMVDFGHHTKFNEKVILSMRDSMIVAALENGCNVIVDDTNLAEKHYNRITSVVNEHFGDDVEVKYVDFTDVPFKTCLARNALRGENAVPEKVIYQMWRRYIVPRREENKVYSSGDTFVVDIDGTLALHESGRNPYDFSRVMEDEVNQSVRDIVTALQSTGQHKVVFVSGRENIGNCYDDTIKWLREVAGVWVDGQSELFMRSEGDERKDDIVKDEIVFQELPTYGYHVKAVIDDRQNVCDMWRSLGVPCMQVDYGIF